MLSTLALATVIQVSPQVQELAPGTRYDPDIPTLEEVVGHDFGEVVTPPDDVIRYIGRWLRRRRTARTLLATRRAGRAVRSSSS